VAERPLSVPPPPFVTGTVWGAGSPPNTVALNVTLVLASTIVGGGAATVNVTLTVWGLLLAPAEVTETVAVYVPAARPLVVAVNVRVLGAVVELRLVLSHPLPVV
jgi:hypothetical protein